MRIAVATSARRRAGGVETYVEQIMGALAEAGHSLALWHEVEGPATAALMALPPGTSRLDLSREADRALASAPDAIVVNGLLDVALEARLLESGRALFVAHNFYGTCISGRKMWGAPIERPCTRRFGAACLVHYFPHRCGGLNPATMLTLYRREARRLTSLRNARYLVTLSEYMRQEYLNHGFDPAQVVCIPYGPSSARPSASESSDWLPRDALVFVGRLERLKGVHVLIEALPRAAARLERRLSLVVVGDGPERAALEQRAAAVMREYPAVSVRFDGWLSPAERDRRLEASDALVVPSVWPEPLGLVGPEAGRLGVPAIAFDVGGVRQWLADGRNGVLAPGNPPTASGLSDAIVAALGDPVRLRQLRAGAMERATASPTPAAHAARLAELLGDAGAATAPD